MKKLPNKQSMGKRIKFPNPNVPKAKFTDEDLILKHSNGLSDRAIGKIFKCHRVTVRLRRCKLGLCANYKPWGNHTEILDENELVSRHKDRLRKCTIRNRLDPERYLKQARYSQNKTCILCGTKISNEGTNCVKCTNIINGKKRKHVTREEYLKYQCWYNKHKRIKLTPSEKDEKTTKDE